MKHWGLAVVVATTLASSWIGAAFGQTGCPATFEGTTAKELLGCITSIQNSISELKNKGAGVLAVGYVDGTTANFSQLSGSIKATVRRTANGAYDVTYFAAQSKAPLVLVGPKSDELISVALTSSSELAFSVVTRGSDGVARNAGFWFAVISP